MLTISDTPAPAPHSVPAFLNYGMSRSFATGQFVSKNQLQISATDYIQLGASPGNAGAINVDSASFPSGNVLMVYNGATLVGFIEGDINNTYLFAAAGKQLRLGANGLAKWVINANTAGISQLQCLSSNCQIVGGAGNGLAILDSTGARNNILITDAGTVITLNDGTNSSALTTTTATTVGAAGGASALPATPLGYFVFQRNGASVKVPYYNP